MVEIGLRTVLHPGCHPPVKNFAQQGFNIEIGNGASGGRQLLIVFTFFLGKKA